MSKDYDYLFKMCIVGDYGIGITDFVKAFIPLSWGHDNPETAEVIGVDFYSDTITLKTKKGPIRVKLQVWDTGGREKFNSIRPMFYRGALGFILFFDLANRESFLHLTDWLEEIKIALKKEKKRRRARGIRGEVPILLVGNKSQSEYYVVSPKEINQFIRKYDVVYIETSTKTKEGIVDSFYCITSLMVGVDVNSEYFLSKDVIYHPKLSKVETATSHPALTPEDLNNLKQKLFQKLEIFEKKLDDIKVQEKDITRHMELKEKELKLKERELALKEEEIAKDSEFKRLPEIKENLSVFISYASKDGELFKIKEIAEALTNYERIKDALYWEEHTEDNIQKYMSDNLDKCDVVLLFCSPNALVSKPVEDEWTTANTLQKPIIPIFNDPDHIPTLLKPRMGVKYDIFDLQKNISNIYNLILKKVEKRLIDIKDLKTDF